MGSSTRVMASASLPGEDEAVHAAVHDLRDDGITGRSRPRREVLHGARIGRPALDGLARSHGLDDLRGLHDRHRAAQPACVDQGVCHRNVSYTNTIWPAPAM